MGCFSSAPGAPGARPQQAAAGSGAAGGGASSSALFGGLWRGSGKAYKQLVGMVRGPQAGVESDGLEKANFNGFVTFVSLAWHDVIDRVTSPKLCVPPRLIQLYHQKKVGAVSPAHVAVSTKRSEAAAVATAVAQLPSPSSAEAEGGASSPRASLGQSVVSMLRKSMAEQHAAATASSAEACVSSAEACVSSAKACVSSGDGPSGSDAATVAVAAQPY